MKLDIKKKNNKYNKNSGLPSGLPFEMQLVKAINSSKARIAWDF